MPVGVYKRTKPHSQLGTHRSEETKRKLSEANSGDKNPNWGKHLSEETKRKISESNKKNPYFKNIPKGEKHPRWKARKKLNCIVCGKTIFVQLWRIKRNARNGRFCSPRCKGIWIYNNFPQRDTSIERLMEDELIRRNIPYTKQVPLLGITLVDFLLPNDIVIYCDGEYWHRRPGAKERDATQDFVLAFHGYKVFRFWEKDIKASVEKCINKIPRAKSLDWKEE